MENMLIWLTALPTPVIMGVLSLMTIILILLRLDQIKKFFSSVFISKKKKRATCADCIKIILSIKEKCLFVCERVTVNILRDQMNFAEQKLSAIEVDLITSFRQMQQQRLAVSDPKYDIYRQNPQMVNKEYIVYREALKNALMCVKDEIRRSFKENGFMVMPAVEFQVYLKTKTERVFSIASEYLLSHYPSFDMLVTIEERMLLTDMRLLTDMVSAIFAQAKEIVSIAENNLKKIEKQFADDIDKIINSKE